MKFQSLETMCSKIKECTSSTNNMKLPYFVNVNSRHDYKAVMNALSDCLQMRKISSSCPKPDCLPDMDCLFTELRSTSKKTLLLGFSNHLKIIDRQSAQTYLGLIKDLPFSNGCLVVLCFQYQEQLEQLMRNDKRLENRVAFLEGENDRRTRVTFVNPQIKPSTIENLKNGYQSYLLSQEQTCDDDAIVSSQLFYEDLSNSSMTIIKIQTSFQMLAFFDRDITCRLVEAWGSDEEWKYLFGLLSADKTLRAIMQTKYGVSEYPKSIFSRWNSFDPNKQWLYFICLKIFETQESYLYIALAEANSSEELIKGIYRVILNYSHTDKLFSVYYDERKELISYIKDLSNICAFIKFAEMKDVNELYYLTDSTDVEKQEIIACLSRKTSFDEEIITTLKKVYPDLAKYLNAYYFDVPMLDEYFQLYKYQKVNNRIQPAFLDLVRQHAQEREYNRLPARNAVFECIDRTDAIIYFVDALGVEFMGYISAICKELGMEIKTSICRANLPSITYYNKDFLQGIDYVDIKDLDNLKHEGEGDFNYQLNKLPLHIVEELKIVREVLEKVKAKLTNHKKAIIVSDHGASRLVVINEQQYKFDVKSNGTHGGRCCLYTDDIPPVEYATVENGQYVLASYDRFKGGRAARVETHGGATFEEVIVPIIEISLSESNIEVQFADSTIFVSFKKKAVLMLFSTQKIDRVTAKINEKFYKSISEDGQSYTIPIVDIKRAGTYYADIYAGDNMVKEHLKFTIKKEGSSEKDLL